MSSRRSVLIIGAGPGGLAAAMLLARAGLDVTVLERQARVGGRTSSLEAEGFRFDMGPTFFLYPRICREIFAACGEALDDHVELRRLDPHYELVFEGRGRLRATPDLQRMQAEIARFCPHDAKHLNRFLHENRAKFEAFTPVLQSAFHGWRDALNPKLARLLSVVRPWASVERDLRRYFRDPHVRLAFSFQSKYLGMSPMRCPSLFTILSYLEYDHGVFHPMGGCAAVSEAMASVARRLGARVHLDEPVRRLCLRGRRVVGAETDERRYDADAVVINADFAQAMHTLVPDAVRRRWRDRVLAKKRYSCSTFMMYLGIEGRYDDLPHHSVFLARDYARNLDEIERQHVLSDNPSVYVQNACVTDPDLAPPGMSTLYVLAPVTHLHRNVDWSRDMPGFRQTVLAQLRKFGLGDLEERIRYERVLTPQHWLDEMNIYRGATFNLAHTFRQMLHLRPRNRFEDLDGVYLVGGGTHPGSGLPVIYESARISSSLLLADFGLPHEWIREVDQDTAPLASVLAPQTPTAAAS